MSRNHHGDFSIFEPRADSWPGRLYAILRTFYSQFLELARSLPIDFDSLAQSFVESIWARCDTDAPQELGRLCRNLKAVVSRFFQLALHPTDLERVITDFVLLVQSTWNPRQLGPDVIYPMQRIRKRQSGRLANLILEHCKFVDHYEWNVEVTFAQGIDPPCVAVMDLDDVFPEVVQNVYNVQADSYGLTCLLIFVEVLITRIVYVSNPLDGDFFGLWITCVRHGLALFVLAAFWGEGTFTLARRSNVFSPGCVVLLDQDFAVILNGSESTLEAIAESGFRLHYARTTSNAVSLTVYLLCNWLVFYPIPRLHYSIVGAVLGHGLFPQMRQLTLTSVRTLSLLRGVTIISCSLVGMMKFAFPSLISSKWPNLALFSIFPFFLILAGHKPRNYPIRSTKLLDALGHPPVRKWQFNTLAAMVTFQCLVICRHIPRPVETVDVLAYLDTFIPDQRDVWKAWKERVADRIVHQSDISFAPTIPTFGDERQVQLRDLLEEAQSGYDMYMRFYGFGAWVTQPDNWSRLSSRDLGSSVLVLLLLGLMMVAI